MQLFVQNDLKIRVVKVKVDQKLKDVVQELVTRKYGSKLGVVGGSTVQVFGQLRGGWCWEGQARAKVEVVGMRRCFFR